MGTDKFIIYWYLMVKYGIVSLREKREKREKQEKQEKQEKRGSTMEIISLKNISKKYDGKLVLDKIDKTFVRGQSIAFVGHNGCGKSTLL